MLKAGVGAIGLGVSGYGAAGVLAQESAGTATAEATPTSCVLAAELTEGPYYIESQLIRRDITEGLPGVPLKLKIIITDPSTCAPLANAAVDIWHCDAQGYYSGISGENPGGGGEATGAENLDTSFLRGIQLTDENGVAEFDTIYLGWYISRTTHIHMKVHVEGEASTTYEEGHVAHTGQLFFDDAISDQIYEIDAYTGRDTSDRTLNDQDNILGDHEDQPGFMLTLTALDDASLETGIMGTITLGVDTAATPSAACGGGGGGTPHNVGPGGPPEVSRPTD